MRVHFSVLRNAKGFSLVELMIVVGIIGVLATLALPRFKQFQAKAKMGEAKNILAHIYTLEQSYSLDQNTYVNFATVGRLATGLLTAASCTPAVGTGAVQIGFRIDPCVVGAPTPRYGYSVTGATTAVFLGRADAGAAAGNLICPGNVAHAFTIDHNNIVVEPGNIGTICAN